MVWAVSLLTYNLRATSLSTIKQIILLRVSLISKEPIQHPPTLISALPKLFYKKMYYLNSFRRKPAISKND